MKRIAHTVWLPEDLHVLVSNHAAALGLSYNNVIIDALHAKFGLDRDPLCTLMQEIRMWLLSKYSRAAFPEDVILQAFIHIQSTPRLLERYEQIVREGRTLKTKSALNRRIGQAVHAVLGGTVIDRKRLSQGCTLIRVYSALTPFRVEVTPSVLA